MKLKGNTKSILNTLYLKGENLFSKRNIQYKRNDQKKISSSPNEMKLSKRLSSIPQAYQVDISNDLANMIKQTPYKVIQLCNTLQELLVALNVFSFKSSSSPGHFTSISMLYGMMQIAWCLRF